MLTLKTRYCHKVFDIKAIISKPEIAKKLKGFTAPRIFKEFPWLRSRLFRSKGFWSPVTDARTGDMHYYNKYLDGQKYGMKNQLKLCAFV